MVYNSLDGEPTPALSHAPSPSPGPTSLLPPPKDSEPVYSPYTDDPEGQDGYDPNAMLQTQKQMIDGKFYIALVPCFFAFFRELDFRIADQDTQLSHLSSSLNRQHHLSLAINSELEEHHGLLEELDTDLEGTRSRLGGARRRLDRVAKGVKGNGKYNFPPLFLRLMQE
jgi:syntaxin 8